MKVLPIPGPVLARKEGLYWPQTAGLSLPMQLGEENGRDKACPTAATTADFPWLVWSWDCTGWLQHAMQPHLFAPLVVVAGADIVLSCLVLSLPGQARCLSLPAVSRRIPCIVF
jgi:hypothetical protein